MSIAHSSRSRLTPTTVKKFTCKFVTAQVAGTFENEISLLCKLKHPSLVRLLGVYINSESVNASMMQLMIIYELMKRGSLQRYEIPVSQPRE